jgi:hypothetical protein
MENGKQNLSRYGSTVSFSRGPLIDVLPAIVAVACERKDGDTLFHSLELLRSINGKGVWNEQHLLLSKC